MPELIISEGVFEAAVHAIRLWVRDAIRDAIKDNKFDSRSLMYQTSTGEFRPGVTVFVVPDAAVSAVRSVIDSLSEEEGREVHVEILKPKNPSAN